MIKRGDALDLILSHDEGIDLIATDPPYALGGKGAEHAISATVAVVLREAARKLKSNRWMLVMAASSWRSTAYMVESVRGVIEPVRMGTWCKPSSRTRARTPGWQWASVKVLVFRKGSPDETGLCDVLDHITEAPVIKGRRAEVPPRVAEWMIRPYSTPGGLMLDPFAGSGAFVDAAERLGMRGLGFERDAPHDLFTAAEAAE